MNIMKAHAEKYYESFMFLLVVISFVTISFNNAFTNLLNWGIWGIFVIDYLYFFIRSDSKRNYVKKHIFELIAIVPLGQGFLLARGFRVIRLIRLTAIGSRYIGPVYQFLKERHLHKLFIALIVIILIMPIPIVFVEPHIHSYADALWWTIVTTTTVGYGDMSPVTPIGRVIAVILMIFGIGLIGLVTSALTSVFIEKDQSRDKLLEVMNIVKELSEEDKELLKQYLNRNSHDV